MDRPTYFPEWASNPPVAPPTTIVAPSAPEQQSGFQPGVAAQVTDFILATAIINSHAYNNQINGVAANFTSDGSATAAEWRIGVRNAINATGQPVTAVDTGTAVRVTANVAGVAFIPTTSDGTNITITQITANRSNKPTRQFLNWLFNGAWIWLVWLAQTIFRTSDFGPDQALPFGTPPPTGAGLGPIAAANFTGRVWVDGYGVGLIDSPAYTYTANSDHYWDLGRNGTWTAVVVASGAGAPAVTALSTRVYMVRTNGTDRTLVTDFRRDHLLITTPLDIQAARFGDNRRGSAAQFAEARRQTRFAAAGSYVLVDEFIDDTNGLTAIGSRIYLRSSTRRPCVVHGAHWDGTQWVRDAAAASVERTDLGWPQTTRVIVTPGATFADSRWDDPPTAVDPNILREQLFNGTVSAGGEQGFSGYTRLMVPSFRSFAPSSNTRTLAREDGNARSYNIGSTGVLGGAVRGAEQATNAYLDPTSGLWTRIQTGVQSWLYQQASNGILIFCRPSGLGDTWDDTNNATTGWTDVAEFLDGSIGLIPDVTMFGDLAVAGDTIGSGLASFTGDLTAGGSTNTDFLTLRAGNNTNSPLAHSFYEQMVPKAGGQIYTNGSAGFTTGGTGFGYTASFVGNNVRITLNNAINASFPEAIIVTFGSNNVGGGNGNVQRWDYIDATHIDISTYLTDSSPGGTRVHADTVVVAFSFEIKYRAV